MRTLEWQTRAAPPPTARQLLEVDSPLLARLLWNRGVRDATAARRFLAPAAQPLGDPSSMRGVREAVAAIGAAIDAGAPIGIHGDYDCDGLSAAAVLAETLERLGATVLVHIPHRARDGYGVTEGAVRDFVARGARLMLTVDCGITANAEVALATALGLDVVVTDHHHAPPELPAARAVINPRQPGCAYPCRDLAGVGVAYTLARALLLARLPRAAAEEAADELLDLVTLGTVADLVPLVEENRTLVARGLGVLNRTRRPGLRALIDAARLTPGALTARDVGFMLASRLNAAGRMGEAADGFALLRAADASSATPLAEAVEQANRARQEAVQDAYKRAAAAADLTAPALVIAGDYPVGIAGLVASRLAETSGRPCVVLEHDGARCRGSARGPEGFHLAQAFAACADLLQRYGGHAQAAGLTLDAANLDAFTTRFQSLARDALAPSGASASLLCEGAQSPRAINWEFAEALRALEPCGMGNPTPLFLSPGVAVREARPVGARGLALRLSDGGPSLRAITFDCREREPRPGDLIDVVYEVERRQWNGEIRLELRLRDWRISTPSA